MLRHVIPLLGAAAAALLCAAAAGAAPRMYVGFLDDASLRYGAARIALFDDVKASGASVVRTVVRWDDVAPRRPAHPADPGDPAYSWDDLDEFVVNAQQRGIEVLLTIWGTPPWANGGRRPNVGPTRPSDLAAFAHALARRYSGAYGGYPFARFYSVWNEPNNPVFLAGPDRAAIYARLAAAAYAGIKSGSPHAAVAIGETSASHAPALFVAAVAHANPRLRFDAWAHHPYPPTGAGTPSTPHRWPDAGLRELPRFEMLLDRAFRRRDLPVWLSEYAESRPAVPTGRQAVDLGRALATAARDPRVQMFVWLMVRNHPGEPWQSGVLGTPSLGRFRAAARAVDPRNPRVELDLHALTHVVQVPALELKWHLPAAAPVGVTYTLSGCGRTVRSAAAARIDADGWVPVRVAFRPRPGARYVLRMNVEDVHGFDVERTAELVTPGDGGLVDRCGAWS